MFCRRRRGVVVTGGALAIAAAGVGAASGLWIGIRSGSNLVDRYTHGQSVSPLDMEALGDYLGVIGGSAGGVAFVGTAARGARLGKTAAYAIGTAHNVAAVAGVAGLVYQGAMLGKNLKDMSPEEQMEEVLKLLAFGGITLAGVAKPRPTVATPRPPVTPIAPASAPPTATLIPPAPTSVTPGFNKLNGKVTLPAKPTPPTKPPNVSIRQRPASGPAPFTIYGNAPFAFPPVSKELQASAGGGKPGGASPVAHDGAPPGDHSRPTVNNRATAPVGPNAQKMAGDKDGKPPKKPTGPSGPPKTGEATPPRPARDGGAPQSAAASPPPAPEGALAAENLPGGLSGEAKRLKDEIERLKSLDAPNLPESKQTALRRDLAAAHKALAVTATRLQSLKAEIIPLLEEIEQIEPREHELRHSSLDPYQPEDARVEASERSAQLRGQLAELHAKLEELLRKVNGPQTRSEDIASDPPRPDPHISTTGGVYGRDLELVQAEMRRAEESLSDIESRLREPHLSRSERLKLLKAYDLHQEWFQDLKERQISLIETKLAEDNGIAFVEYEAFKSRRPLSDNEYALFLKNKVGFLVTPTEGMSVPETLNAMNNDLARVDRHMVLASRHHRDLLERGEPPEAIERAAEALETRMKERMVLERLFGIKRKIIERQVAINSEGAAEDYKEFLGRQKPMSAEDRQATLDFVNKIVGLKPGMSNAEILSAMDAGMARIDKDIVEQHRKYQDMRAERTATEKDIQREARDLEILMTCKMVLEEQMAKYTN
jgi:hypothetical protein